MMRHEVPVVDTGYGELERALTSVPGILTASVAVSQETGRGRLRIRLAPGEDTEAVSWTIAATLQERFGISLAPDAIRARDPEHDTATEAVAFPDVAAIDVPEADRVGQPQQAGPARPRVAIRDLVTRTVDREVEVIATLALGPTERSGTARAAPGRSGLLRGVADATIRALRGLTGDHLLARVDRVTLSEVTPAVATVVARLYADRGEETLVGVSLVRGDDQRAVMRATLDSLNRRVEPWLRTSSHG